MGWVALIDLLEGGHHSTYLILFTQALLRLGCRVVVICPQPQEIIDAARTDGAVEDSDEVADRLRGVAAKSPIGSQFVVGRLRSRFNAIAQWQLAARLLRQWGQATGLSPDLVIFSYLDEYLSPYLLSQEVDRRFPFPWAGLYMKPKYLRQQPRLARLRCLLGNAQPLRSRYCRAIATLDGGVLDGLQAEAGDTPVIGFPDIADDAAPQTDYGPAQAIAAQAQGCTVVGLLGALDRRKGIITLLEIARQAQAQPYLFAMVGRFSQAEFNPEELRLVLAAIKAQPPNCFFHLESMPGEAEFNAVVASFDIVFAAYYQFPCSSNMLAKAALFRKPLIVSEGFYMAEQVRRYGLGLVVPEDDPAACLAAIATLTQLSPAAIATMEQGMAQYLRDNSYERLVVCLERLLGRSAPPHR